jgi:putative membrane protein
VDAPIKEQPPADLRDYLAEERTFLAWIRTGIALMVFGLVTAQFQLFADGPHLTPPAAGARFHGPSLWFGAALFVIGVTVHLVSAWRYVRLVGELRRGQFVHRSVSKLGVIIALSLALVGIAMTTYLVLALGQPLHSLQAQSAIPLAP